MVQFKHILSSAVILMIAANPMAFNAMAELPLSEQFVLDQVREKVAEKRSRGVDEVETYNAFFKLNDADNTLRAIEEKGGKLLNHIGDYYIINMPLDSVETIYETPGVEVMELDRELKPNLMEAKKVGDVNAVHMGTNLDGYSLDGEGVIVALFDSGLDPNHINFDNRVEAVYHYQTTTPKIYYGSDVANFTTDNTSATHGTHVLGIMTGSVDKIGSYYDYLRDAQGNIRYAPTGAPYRTTMTNADNPFKGVAPGARVVVACGQLASTYIVDGIQRISEYAISEGVPVIMNLSLGGNAGPRDGSDAFASSLSALAQKYPNTTICISSGNEGDYKEFITGQTTADNLTFKTFIMPENRSSFTQALRFSNASFSVDIYADDDKEFTGRVAFYTNTGSLITSYEITKSALLPKSLISTALKPYYSSGSMTTQRGVDASSKRYKATLNFTSVTQTQTQVAYMSLEITTAAPQRIDAFTTYGSGSTGALFSSSNRDGWTEPDGNMSINYLACAKGVVAVGAMTSAVDFFSLDGNLYSYDGKDGDIADFSSFGKLIDGRSLPHFVAPGHAITSSISRPYTDLYYSSLYRGGTLVATSTANGKNYYWEKMSGTSMACPFATGTFALFQQAALEAKGRPLTADELIEVAQKTAINDDFVKAGNPIQWGAGKLNAYDGVKQIMGLSSLGKVNIDQRDEDNAFMYQLRGRDLNVFVAGASGITLDVYGITGQRLASRSIGGSELNHSLADLGSGIYVISVTTPEGGKYSKKISLH